MNRYYSQHEQDKFLNEKYFKNKNDGFFVDVGAHNGISINNSYYFEKRLGWNGICIEPNPKIFKKLNSKRKSMNLQCAIDSDDNGQVEFVLNTGYTEMLSGILKYYDDRHLERKDDEIKRFGGTSEIIKVKTRSLESIFDEHNIKKVDYLSIDVEGAELSVIESVNFDKVFVDFIGFEDNYPDTSTPIKELLENNGYVFVKRLGCDIIMKHKDSEYNL